MTGVEEDKMLAVRGTSRSSIWSSYKAIVRNSFVSIVDRICNPFTTQIIRNQQKGAQVLFSQAFLSTGYHKYFPSLTMPTRGDRLGAGGERKCVVPNPVIPLN